MEMTVPIVLVVALPMFVLTRLAKRVFFQLNSKYKVGTTFYPPFCFSQNSTVVALFRSALVNIRRKALLSSVGFRKRMTSRSPRRLIYDSSTLRSSISDLFDFWWEILSHFFDQSSIDSDQFKQEDATAAIYRMFWCFKPLLTPREKEPFSGCYWITSFEWPQITRLCI